MSDDSRSLDDLDPRVAAMARAHIAACEAEGIRVLVICTYRSDATQARLYAQGRTAPGHIVTNARPGDSFHNYRLAYDIVPRKANGAVDWDNASTAAKKRWARIGALGEAAGMTWGGRFVSITDLPHFQWSGGLTIKDLKKGQRP